MLMGPVVNDLALFTPKNEDLHQSRETLLLPAPKDCQNNCARRNQERVKSILLLAIPDEYLLKFHNVVDAKSLWEAIKSRFSGNVESKKMQKNVLKHQFEKFSTASNENLDKAYDRFQKLISQLDVHGAPISKEDINQKFLRSLLPSWNQIALIMRNNPDIDEIDIDDLYNNLRVYEDELKSTAGGINQVPSTSCAHDMDGDDLEELDLRWQVAMLTVRVKKKGHFARECRSGRNQGRRSYGDNSKSNAPTNESSSQALVAQQDGLGGYDWSNDFEVEPVNYAFMAISSSSSSSSYCTVMIQVAYLQEDPYSMITKKERRLQRYDLQLIYVWWHVQGDLDFVSFREMITSQLQGKLWLYDEVRTRLCLFCHHQIGEDCWDS
ncbi:hypothetical protein Tco_0870105 [Tanacetum coccineum]